MCDIDSITETVMHRIILIILAQAIKMFYLKLNYEMNLFSEILSFFIRQEMGNTSTCNLRNKMCITIINDYVQLPLLSGKKILSSAILSTRNNLAGRNAI